MAMLVVTQDIHDFNEGNQMAARRRFEVTWVAKHLCDGALTLDQMADALEKEAKRLRQMSQDGVAPDERLVALCDLNEMVFR